MTLLLALETATRATSVALLRGAELVAQEVGAPEGHAAETLLPALDALLARTGVALAELGAFAISSGPGSFTGLRVGLATLKGLAFGSATPVVSVPTLAALAEAAPRRDLPVVPLLDARRGELYAGVFDLSGELPRATTPVGVYTPAELAPLLPAACRVLVDASDVFAADFLAVLGPGARQIAVAARAVHVGRVGARMLAQGAGQPAAAVVPHYIRRAEAEVKRTGVRFEPLA